MDSKITELKNIVAKSNYIVFFGGAGVSTESGVPDFRSVDGLYNQSYKYPPETILSHTFFMRNTEEFYKFYKDKMLFKDVEPNNAHKALAKLTTPLALASMSRQAIGARQTFTAPCMQIMDTARDIARKAMHAHSFSVSTHTPWVTLAAASRSTGI